MVSEQERLALEIGITTACPGDGISCESIQVTEPGGRGMALASVSRLFDQLNASGVRYCHWKSNCNLGRSLRGATDLDLLVDPCDANRFRSILYKHDLKALVVAPDQQYPSIEHYLGFDAQTGRLFHPHVHYQLVLGEQFVKNYRLPLERAVLDSARMEKGIKIPSPELELVLLAVRALLKYRDRDVIKDVLSIRTPGLPPAILKEFEYLLQRTNWEGVRRALEANAGLISPAIIHDLLHTVANSPRSGRVLHRLRAAVRQEMSAWQRHSRWRAVGTYFAALLRKRLFFVGSSSSEKTPATGGRVIAVIGADGSGKSTVSHELCKWLSYQLRTYHYYMGSQQPSRMTRAIHTGYRIVRKLHKICARLPGQGRVIGQALGWLRCLWRNLEHLSVGRDRYRRYRAGRHKAAQGMVVICDRYPLKAIHRVMEKRPMDGPQIAATMGSEMDRTTRVLSRLEEGIYRTIHPPDCIVALRVSPEVALQRKPGHDPEVIEAKSRAIERMERRGLQVIDVDADQAYEQVLLQVKAAIWQLL